MLQMIDKNDKYWPYNAYKQLTIVVSIKVYINRFVS